MKDDRDVDLKGHHLEGKSIDVVVTGGIAAIETPKIIRELRRFGANVRVIMTPSAIQFVSPLVFEWASKNSVVTELSGSAEHITLANAVVVAPATLDFISKIALGLSDSAAATLVQSAVSRVPVLFAPSMHLSLQGNPAFARNLNLLREIPKVSILSPLESEGKAKMLGFGAIAAEVCHRLADSKLSQISAVISLGPTRSYADDMRFLSNRSSGSLGLAIADEFFRRGAQVSTICGAIQRQVPEYLNPSFVETNDQMKTEFQKIASTKNARVGVFSAAVLDFEISNPASGKFSSKENWDLKLKPSAKLVQTIHAEKMLRVGFKLESKLSVEELKDRAQKWVTLNPCELLVANRLEDVGESAHKAFIYSSSTHSFIEANSKHEIANVICNLLEPLI